MISLAQVAYEAYSANTNGKTFDGRDMPKWSELPQHTLDAWAAAVAAVEAVLTPAPVQP